MTAMGRKEIGWTFRVLGFGNRDFEVLLPLLQCALYRRWFAIAFRGSILENSKEVRF
jgi:hypothetical protein